MPSRTVRSVVASLFAPFCVALFGGLAVEHSAAAEPEGSGPYLFSYFKNNGEDGLHLAWSEDGDRWTSLNGDRSFVAPTVGGKLMRDPSIVAPTVGGKLMRDPSIVRDAEGRFHMVWSSSWEDRGFGYASSPDLIEWSEQRFLPVNESVPGAKNTWAPDLFYDGPTRQYVAVFATTVPGRFPETDGGGDQNHRLYHVTTKDFQNWSAPALAMNPGHNSIDGTLFRFGDTLSMIYKDERPDHKRLHQVTSGGLGQPWSAPSAPIIARDWVEGPTVLKLGKRWRVYFDCYTKGHYGAAETEDGVTWTDVSDRVLFPKGARHGTALAISREVLKRLQDRKSAD